MNTTYKQFLPKKLTFKIRFSYAEICAEPSWIEYFARESVLYAGNITHEVSTLLYFKVHIF